MKKIYFFIISIFISGFSIAQCPTITCPANIAVGNDAGMCGAVVNYTAPIGTNPCGLTTQTFNYTGSIVNWTVPAGVTSVTIEARGAQGGYNTNSTTQSGLGATMIGTFAVTPGAQLKILVGEQPSTNAGNGGGGGTFVTDMSDVPLIIAGGGGGSSQGADSPDKNGQIGSTGGTGAGGGGTGGSAGNGGGIGGAGFQSGAGGGLLTNGADGWTSATGGFAFINGGAGAPTNAPARGGFGGGGSGSSYVVGGGGGGYSGGGSGGNSTAGVGGGGGSYNAGTSQTNTGGVNSGNGLVTITYNGGGTVTTTQTAGLASGALFPVGTTTQTFQVDDGLGNTTTCSFTITVNDTEAPVITCPANIAVSNDAGTCGAVVTYTTPTGTDNCSGAVTVQTAGLASGATFPVGTTTNTFTTTDASSNTTSCSFTVTITDSESPIFSSCPSNVSSCNSTVTGIAPGTASDNCTSVSTVTYQLTGATTGTGTNDASGTTFNLGTTTVLYTATDINGNTGTCSFTVTIEDTQAPVFVTCHSDTSTCGPVVNGIAPGSVSDNCAVSPGISYLFSGATSGTGAGDASGNTFNVGTTLVQYIVADNFGNTDTCSFNVTVNSMPSVTASTPDSVACISDGTIALNGSPASGTWSGAGVAGSIFTPSTAGIGTHILIYSFTSIDGCTNTDSTTVTVLGCAGLSENSTDGMNIYPNPTSDYITIDLLKSYEEIEISIGDPSGKHIATKHFQSQQKAVVSLQELPAGVYFINVVTVDGNRTFRIVKK